MPDETQKVADEAVVRSGAKCMRCGAEASQPAFLEHREVAGKPCPNERPNERFGAVRR